jgi:hypothetical protein
MGAPQTPVARMDKSMPYGEVHGERVPDDRHANVHFFQNGLPFNAQGVLLHDHPDVERDPKLKALAALMLKKASKKKVSAPGDDAAADPDADPDDNDGVDNDPVNLSEWAKGQQRVEWQNVSDAIAARYKKRIGNKREALEFLIEQRAVSMAELSAEHKKQLDI